MNSNTLATGDATGPEPDSKAVVDWNPTRGLTQALRNAGVTVLYQDAALSLTWSQNLPREWAGAAAEGARDADFLPASTAEKVVEAKREVIASSKPQRLEVTVPAPNGDQWFDLWIDADVNDVGVVRGVFTTAINITDQKHREQTLRTLLREVSHRSKNLLAIIQSIATQTGRYAMTIDGFLTRFRGRIQSLASSQDLVTSSNWRGADFRELVIGQVARYSASPQKAVRFEGERLWLNPNAALHIGLAMHELAVNSVSFGALSRADGSVNVSAHLVDGPPGETALAITWKETIEAGSVEDEATRERRFGSVALERIVPASLNGTARLEIAPHKVEYRLFVPFGSFELD